MQFIKQRSSGLVRWLTMIFLFPLVLVGMALRIYDKYNSDEESPINF